MTKPHPLTDEMCYQLTINNMEAHGELRDAYDIGSTDMLEKVIEWLKANPVEDYVWADYTGAIVKEQEFLENFKKAMRPQEES